MEYDDHEDNGDDDVDDDDDDDEDGDDYDDDKTEDDMKSRSVWQLSGNPGGICFCLLRQ